MSLAVRAPTPTKPFTISAAQTPPHPPPGEDFHDTTSRASPVQVQVVPWANGVPRIRLEHRSRMRALCRVGKIEAMDPWPFLWVLSETSEDGVTGKETCMCISEYRNRCASNFHYKFNDAISLPRSNILWHHGSGSYWGSAEAGTHFDS